MEELESLRRGPANETSKEKIDRWHKFLAACKAFEKAGGTLTPEQEDDRYFMEYKLEDWATD